MNDKILDPTGRHIRTRTIDDRGERFPIIQSAPVQALGFGDFQEIYRTENMDRARRGHVVFSFDAVYDDATRLFAMHMLEVNVIGYVGNAATLIEYVTLDVNALGECQWFDPETFSNIAFEVRQNIDGVNTADTTGIDSCTFNVQGAYWR